MEWSAVPHATAVARRSHTFSSNFHSNLFTRQYAGRSAGLNAVKTLSAPARAVTTRGKRRAQCCRPLSEQKVKGRRSHKNFVTLFYSRFLQSSRAPPATTLWSARLPCAGLYFSPSAFSFYPPSYGAGQLTGTIPMHPLSLSNLFHSESLIIAPVFIWDVMLNHPIHSFRGRWLIIAFLTCNQLIG